LQYCVLVLLNYMEVIGWLIGHLYFKLAVYPRHI
jgi:hypothetical protein